MEGFKNSTRMKTFGDVAPQAYAKGGSVKPAAKVGKVMGEFAEGKLHSGSKTGPKVTSKKQAIAIGISEAKKAGAKGPMKKANGGEIVRMTDAERRASLEMPSRGMTPAEARALRATMAAKAAAPKRGPLIQPKNSNPMSPAEVRRLIEMDRPTNSRGAEAYKGGGKVGGSKVPFLEKKIAEGKKVMRKAMGGAVNMPEMPTDYSPPPAPVVAADYQPQVMPTRPTPMPEMPTDYSAPPAPAPMISPEYLQAMQEMRAMQDMQAQREAAQIRREAAPRFMR